MAQSQAVPAAGSKWETIDSFLSSNADVKIVQTYRRNSIPEQQNGKSWAIDPEIIEYYVTRASGPLESVQALNQFTLSLIPHNVQPLRHDPYVHNSPRLGYLTFSEQLDQSAIERLLSEAGRGPTDFVIYNSLGNQIPKDLRNENRRIIIHLAPSESVAQLMVDSDKALHEGRIKDFDALIREVVMSFCGLPYM